MFLCNVLCSRNVLPLVQAMPAVVQWAMIMTKPYVYAGLCAALVLFSSCAHTESKSARTAMLADIEPFSLGSRSISVETMLTAKLKAVDAEVVFYPRTNEVALEFRHELVNFRQFWTETGRQHFMDALNQYKEDYANKNLVTRTGKSRAIYGKEQLRFEWKAFKYTGTFESLPWVSLGYRFKKNAKKDVPYFCTYQLSANDIRLNPGQGKHSSRQMSIYYTRAQAEEVAKLFDQQYLLQSLAGKASSAPAEAVVPEDVY